MWAKRRLVGGEKRKRPGVNVAPVVDGKKLELRRHLRKRDRPLKHSGKKEIRAE